jgi:hypothetical protein
LRQAPQNQNRPLSIILSSLAVVVVLTPTQAAAVQVDSKMDRHFLLVHHLQSQSAPVAQAVLVVA